MLDLGLSILFSSILFVIFKLFGIYKVQILYAITTNYIVAFLVALFLYEEPIVVAEIISKSWFFGGLSLGVLFIIVFNLFAITTQKVGISVVSVASKMSFVIPVLFAVIAYGETLSTMKIIGIALAICAVYLTAMKSNSTSFNKKDFLFPVLVFLGSGAIDLCLNYFQEFKVSESEFPLFSAMVFGAAGSVGIILIGINTFRKTFKINYKNLIGGIVLGVLNYFSIHFLLRALHNPNLQSATIFTVNNVAIVTLSTMLGILLFKEKINTKNWIGIAIAILSIIFVSIP